MTPPHTANGAAGPDLTDSPAAWLRLGVALAFSTIGGVGMWSVVVVLQLGFDLRSAATILAIPRGTVASRLYAARQAIAMALLGEEEQHV